MRVIATTDLHVHLLGYDYYADRPDPGVGLEGLAELIEAARAEAPNSLLLDNGDFLQGTPLGDVFADRNATDGSRRGRRKPHPALAAMNALRYDAATIGNHEFNYGLDFLVDALSEAEFPVVSANTVLTPGARAQGDVTLLKPYTLIDREVLDANGIPHRLRIGVIGFLPPQILVWEHKHLDGRLHVRDIVEAACAWVPRMRAEGADLVIGLAHTGIADAENRPGMENAAIPLARLGGLDAMILGHTHEVFPDDAYTGRQGLDPERGLIGGIPAVKAGFWGSHLGLIDLWLRCEEGSWHVAQSRSEVRHVRDTRAPREATVQSRTPPPRSAAFRESAKLPPQAPSGTEGTEDAVTRLRRVVATAHADTLAAVRKPVGESQVPLHSYFALLGHAPASQLVADAKIAHIRDRLRGTAHEGLPVLAAVAPFKAGGRGGPRHYTDVPAGPIALRHVADLYSYPNTVSALRVTGDLLRDWLERSASLFNTLPPGSGEGELIDIDMPTYNFDAIHGITYAIDLTEEPLFAPDGTRISTRPGRIRDLCCDGREVRRGDAFVIATNSYRAGGGGNFPGTGMRHMVYEGDSSIRDMLRDHIARLGSVAPSAKGPWQFLDVPGVRAMFETGVAAEGHLHEIAHLDPQPAGITAQGFLRLRLRLGLRPEMESELPPTKAIGLH